MMTRIMKKREWCVYPPSMSVEHRYRHERASESTCMVGIYIDLHASLNTYNNTMPLAFWDHSLIRGQN